MPLLPAPLQEVAEGEAQHPPVTGATSQLPALTEATPPAGTHTSTWPEAS